MHTYILLHIYYAGLREILPVAFIRYIYLDIILSIHPREVVAIPSLGVSVGRRLDGYGDRLGRVVGDESEVAHWRIGHLAHKDSTLNQSKCIGYIYIHTYTLRS